MRSGRAVPKIPYPLNDNRPDTDPLGAFEPHEARFAFEQMGSSLRLCNNIDDRFDKLLRLRAVAQIILNRLSRAHTRSQRASPGCRQCGLADGLGCGLLIRCDCAPKVEIASREVDVDWGPAVERPSRPGSGESPRRSRSIPRCRSLRVPPRTSEMTQAGRRAGTRSPLPLARTELGASRRIRVLPPLGCENPSLERPHGPAVPCVVPDQT